MLAKPLYNTRIIEPPVSRQGNHSINPIAQQALVYLLFLLGTVLRREHLYHDLIPTTGRYIQHTVDYLDICPWNRKADRACPL